MPSSIQPNQAAQKPTTCWRLSGVRLPLGVAMDAILNVILLFDVLWFSLFDGPIGEFGKSAPDATQHAVVLAAVKDAARR
jgi:hypothetical protein